MSNALDDMYRFKRKIHPSRERSPGTPELRICETDQGGLLVHTTGRTPESVSGDGVNLRECRRLKSNEARCGVRPVPSTSEGPVNEFP